MKSCIVLHMLVDLIGDAPFRDIVRQLIEDIDDAALESGVASHDPVPVATPNIYPSYQGLPCVVKFYFTIDGSISGTPLATGTEKGSTGSARGISTKRLLKLCRHRSALNLDDFCERWINGVRCPILKVH